jgi:dTMP kinase
VPILNPSAAAAIIRGTIKIAYTANLSRLKVGKAAAIHHIERAVSRLREAGHSVHVVREPGGTDVGEQIRHILQYSKQSATMVPETELLLFCASRAQLVRELIRPALDGGKIVIADRFFDSTTVYQCVGRKIPGEAVAFINRFAIGDCLRPRLLSTSTLLAWNGSSNSPGKPIARILQRVRQGCLKLAQREPWRVKVIDFSQPIAAARKKFGASRMSFATTNSTS